MARREEPGESEAGGRGEGGQEKDEKEVKESQRPVAVCRGKVSVESELLLPGDSKDLARRMATQERLAMLTWLTLAMGEVLAS